MIGKHAAVPSGCTVDGARDPDGQALHSAGERELVGCFNDEVDVVSLHRVVDNAEIDAVAAGVQRGSHCFDDVAAAKPGSILADAPHCMHRKPCSVCRPLLVRNAFQTTLGLAPCSLPTPAPSVQIELPRAFHLDWGL